MAQTEASSVTGQTIPAGEVPPMSVEKRLIGSSQSLVALSGLGLAYGPIKSALSKLKRATSLNTLKLPRVMKNIPKYMKTKYVQYPLLVMLLLAATRRVRAAINH